MSQKYPLTKQRYSDLFLELKSLGLLVLQSFLPCLIKLKVIQNTSLAHMRLESFKHLNTLLNFNLQRQQFNTNVKI